ncbi:MAG TPA: lysophospholipid acyltransferase family protein [bacterium]|nr:lysophospholipid acyltransferase family protein [bacterium]
MRPIYRTILAVARIVYHLLWWPRFSGRENLPSGPFLLCANHRSWFDPPLLALLVSREVGFLAKAELFKNPLFGRLIWTINARPIRRGVVDRAAIDHVIGLLKDNRPVVAFPEGTRSRDGQMQPPKPGIGMMARLAAVPVVPVYISGSHKLARRLFHWGRLRVRIGDPIPVSEVLSFADDKDGYRRLSRRIMERICALSDDPEHDRATALAAES